MENSATCIDLEGLNERNTYASQPPVSDGSNNGANPTETEADAGKSSAEPQNVSQADKEPHANNPKSFKERMGNVEYRKELMNALQCILLSLGGMITAPTLVQRYNCLVCLLIDPHNIKGACEWTNLRKSAVYELRNRLFSLKEPSNIESLFRDKPGRGPKNRLGDMKDVIIDLLETKNLHTIQEIQDAIKERTGVTCNRKTLSEFLRDNNYKKLKCGSIPAKADIGKQVEFYKDLQGLMDQAKKGEIELFFVDASHFVFGGDYCGYVYCRNRRFLRTWNGRKRYNVLGALHYATNEILTVTDDTHIDSIVVRKLLDLLHERYPMR